MIFTKSQVNNLSGSAQSHAIQLLNDYNAKENQEDLVISLTTPLVSIERLTELRENEPAQYDSISNDNILKQVQIMFQDIISRDPDLLQEYNEQYKGKIEKDIENRKEQAKNIENIIEADDEIKTPSGDNKDDGSR